MPAKPANATARVVVRVRGIDGRREHKKSDNVKLTVSGKQLSVEAKNQTEAKLNFDALYDANSVNEDVFHGEVDGYIPQVFDGYNLSIMAYGGAKSGRNHLLGGSESEEGLFRRISNVIFKTAKARAQEEHLVTVSMYQIRNENVSDLLDPSEKTSLLVSDHPVSGAYVEAVAQIVVKNAAELDTLITEGNRVVKLLQRRVSGLSAPHVITDIHVETKGQGKGKVRTALLRIAKIAGAKGVSMQRNAGLKALSGVVSALASGYDALSVPFNGSNLTRLLKPALAGNAKALVLGFVDEAAAIRDTQITLELLEKIQTLSSAVSVNYNMVGDAITTLRAKISEARGKLALRSHPVQLMHDVDKSLIEELAQLIKELNHIKRQSWAAKRATSAEILANRNAHLESTGLHLCRIDANAGSAEKSKADTAANEILKVLTTQLDAYLRDDATLQIKKNKLAKFKELDAKSEQTTRTQREVDTLEVKVQALHKKLALKQLQYQKKMKDILEIETQQKKLNLLVKDDADVNHLQALSKYVDMKKRISSDSGLTTTLEELEVQMQTALSQIDNKFDSVPGSDFLKQIAIDSTTNYYEHKMKALRMEFERGQLWETYLRSNFRHKAQMERLEEHTFTIFRNYRRHFEKQRQLSENRYRDLVDNSVRDSLKLQEENTRLKALINQRNKP